MISGCDGFAKGLISVVQLLGRWVAYSDAEHAIGDENKISGPLRAQIDPPPSVVEKGMVTVEESGQLRTLHQTLRPKFSETLR